jgi:GNAT superfamily N-acetyltransferase
MPEDLDPTLRQPAACSAKELAEFERLILLGREVTALGLRGRIREAECLAFIAGQNGEFMAVGALKHPSAAYRSRVFKKARSRKDPGDFALELGWMYVAEEHRRGGLASRLVGAMVGVASGTSLYATSRSNNVAMHSALKRHGFVATGSAYKSEGGDDELVLFVRSA